MLLPGTCYLSLTGSEQWFDEIPFAAKVKGKLKSDPGDYADEIRAASVLFVRQGRTCMWPIEDIDRCLNLGITLTVKVLAIYREQTGPG